MNYQWHTVSAVPNPTIQAWFVDTPNCRSMPVVLVLQHQYAIDDRDEIDFERGPVGGSQVTHFVVDEVNDVEEFDASASAHPDFIGFFPIGSRPSPRVIQAARLRITAARKAATTEGAS